MICARRHPWSWREGRCFSLQIPGDTVIINIAKNLPSFIAIKWLGSNKSHGLLSKCPYLNHIMETFLLKTNCACDVAQSRPYILRQLFAIMRIHTTNITMLDKQRQSLPKPPLPASAAHSLLSAIDCFKELHQVVHYNIASF